MSYGTVREFGHDRPLGEATGWAGTWIGMLALTKVLDAGTTAVGLIYVPGFVEANLLPARVFDALGVAAGLLVLSVLIVALVTLVTEAGARYLHGHPEAPGWGPTVTRFVGYVPISVVFGAAALHNAGLILRALLLG